MKTPKPRNAFHLTFEHTDEDPPDGSLRRVLLWVGVSMVLWVFPAALSEPIGTFLASSLAH